MHVLILITNKTKGKMKKNIIRMHVLILVTNKTKGKMKKISECMF